MRPVSGQKCFVLTQEPALLFLEFCQPASVLALVLVHAARRQVPVSRLVLNRTALADLFNRIGQLGGALKKAGVIAEGAAKPDAATPAPTRQ